MRLAAVALLAAVSLQAQDDGGVRPLFNGRDLSGWVNVNCAPETWSVRDGMIHSTGKPICELRTDRMYENFILELEYQHQVAGGNAGLFIWGDALTARGQPFVRAIEVQILDGRNTDNYTSHGDVFPIHGARMTPDRPHPGGWDRSLPSERRARPAGEWNHYRVTARDGTITLAVNGKDVSGGRDIVPRKGYIHLESEGGEVLYRNIRIRELPGSAKLASDQIARADEGFVTIYTGTDFRGWQFPSGHEGHWVSKDWIIAYDGQSAASDKNLWTDKAYGDVTVIADWRRGGVRPGSDQAQTGVAPGADQGQTAGEADALPIAFHGVDLPEDARRRVAQALGASAGEKPRWHRAVFSKRNGRLGLTIDGQTIVDGALVPGATAPSRIGLRHQAAPIEFANIFVKE